MYWLFIGLSFIFSMTMLGVFLAVFIKPKRIDDSTILSFALGVMLSSGIFSLLLPAYKMIRDNNQTFWAIVIGFLIGVCLIIFIPIFISKRLNEKNRLFLAMTIHNIPEGFSVGLSLYIACICKDRELLVNAIMLFLAIGIQNIPEGFATAIPYTIDEGRKKACLLGFISSIVEPLAGLLALIFVSCGKTIQPYGMSIGAGAMLVTVLIELKESFNLKGIISFIVGFSLMTLLDLFL